MRNPFFLPSILPKRLGLPGRNHIAAGLSQQLASAATCEGDKLVADLGSSPTGLVQGEAERRLEQYGPNAVAQEERHTYRDLLVKALLNPLVILLSLLAVVSALTGDLRAAVVMVMMVVLGVALRFVQEARASTAAAKLKAMIRVTATVIREDRTREIPLVGAGAGRHRARVGRGHDPG